MKVAYFYSGHWHYGKCDKVKCVKVCVVATEQEKHTLIVFLGVVEPGVMWNCTGLDLV